MKQQRRRRHLVRMLPVPLLSLAAPALALGEDLAFGDYGESTTHNVGDIWNGEL